MRETTRFRQGLLAVGTVALVALSLAMVTVGFRTSVHMYRRLVAWRFRPVASRVVVGTAVRTTAVQASYQGQGLLRLMSETTSDSAGLSAAPATAAADGPTGPAGTDGAAGVDGAEGPAGPDGPAGPPGPVGPEGSAGATGPAGSEGSAGATGPAGPGLTPTAVDGGGFELVSPDGVSYRIHVTNTGILFVGPKTTEMWTDTSQFQSLVP